MSEITNTKPQAFIIALLEKMEQEGSWCGETHIQKTMFALDKLLNVSTGFEFILYRHGPYSFDLHEELLGMTASGALAVESKVPYGPSIRPTENGKKLLLRFPHTIKRVQKHLEFVAKNFSTERVSALEKDATALYVTIENGAMDNQERAREVTRLKPHISLANSLEAVEKIEELIKKARKEKLLN